MRRLSFILILFSLVSCADFGKKVRSFLGGDDSAEVAAAKNAKSKRFSNNSNIGYKAGERKYRRYTVADFEREEGLTREGAGSLWVMEGQGSYLFTDNLQRNVGDIIGIELDGNPKTQLATKATVLKKLMEKGKRKIASVPSPTGPAPTTPAPASVAAAATTPQATVAAPPPEEEKEDEQTNDFNVDIVPARIVEKLPDGTYRVRGTQAFMIGKKEHRVIVTGIVRPGDISSDKIASSRVLDPKFDIVGLKKELR